MRPAPTSAASRAGATPVAPSARIALESWRPLIDEVQRAELSINGPLIDLGTADQHKYTRGGWRTGWGANAQQGELRIGRVDARRALIDVVLPDAAVAVAFRARSAVAGQSVRVSVDGQTLGSIALGADWAEYRIDAPRGTGSSAGPLAPGRHLIELTFSAKRSGEPRAELDWLWLPRSGAGSSPGIAGIRVMPIRVGDEPRRALIAPTARTYSFYLQPPPDAALVFEYGSDAGATFAVTAVADGERPARLFSATGGDAWVEAKVDLAAYAGRAIRLDLAVSGAGGVTGWAEPVIMVPPRAKPASSDAAPLAGPAPKNVLLILMDTARADAFGPFARGPEVKTPSYDAFAARSTVFRNAYNNENWTKPSVSTTLSSLYPSTHDTKRDASSLPPEVELVSQHLRRAGFTTAGFIANGYISNKFGFEKGWDQFKNYIREGIPSEAERVYADALAWLTRERDASKPFFLYIQTIDPHVNYEVDTAYTDYYFREPYDGVLGKVIDANELAGISSGKLSVSERDIGWLRAVYRGEITYHDEHLGEFLAALEAAGRMDDTLIVITNDHGEELGDHGKFGHGHTLYEEMIRAPLLMHYPPKLPAGRAIDEIVENVDVVPTVLELLGAPPMKHAEGQSLVALVEGKAGTRPYYSITEFLGGRRAIRVGRWKLLRSSSDWIELYDVVADPAEKRDRTGDSPIARRLCEVYLGEGLATPDKRIRLQDVTVRRRLRAGEARISPQMRRQLEALGYLGDDAHDDDDDDDDDK